MEGTLTLIFDSTFLAILMATWLAESGKLHTRMLMALGFGHKYWSPSYPRSLQVSFQGTRFHNIHWRQSSTL